MGRIADRVVLDLAGVDYIAATRTLVREGFVVLPYTTDDPVVCRKLEDAGASAVMPLAAPIGSGLGIQNANNLRIIREFARVPVALYGTVLLCAAIAYFILTRALLGQHERDSELARALGRDFKEKVSIVMYVVAVASSALSAWPACALYVAVAIMWLVPDRRIERTLARPDEHPAASRS